MLKIISINVGIEELQTDQNCQPINWTITLIACKASSNKASGDNNDCQSICDSYSSHKLLAAPASSYRLSNAALNNSQHAVKTKTNNSRYHKL